MLVTQSCLTLRDPMDCSPPGSSVHGIFQVRKWSGLPFSTYTDANHQSYFYRINKLKKIVFIIL